MSQSTQQIKWQESTVSSHHIAQPIPVIVAKDIPYFEGANRLQNLNVYLPVTDATSELVGTSVTSIPAAIDTDGSLLRTLVHIHGGAW